MKFKYVTFYSTKFIIRVGIILKFSRSQWPRGLRRRSAAARLLRLWVRIPPGAWIFVFCECYVLSGRGLCDELITRPGVLPNVMRHCVLSRNLLNKEAMAHWGCCAKKKTTILQFKSHTIHKKLQKMYAEIILQITVYIAQFFRRAMNFVPMIQRDSRKKSQFPSSMITANGPLVVSQETVIPCGLWMQNITYVSPS